MKHELVVSSNVVSAGYDEKTATLEILFLNGHMYRYLEVPLRVYREFMDAKSKGRFVWDVLEPHYVVEKVR